MGHPYRIREIAQQAGLSEATVDRVLNGRTGVRAKTLSWSLPCRLADARVPVVTLVTDLPRSRPIGYVGINNHAPEPLPPSWTAGWLARLDG